MILIHEAMNRGHTDMGWLKSDHSFSFGGFLDPTRMGYARIARHQRGPHRARLRVW